MAVMVTALAVALVVVTDEPAFITKSPTTPPSLLIVAANVPEPTLMGPVSEIPSSLVKVIFPFVVAAPTVRPPVVS